MFEKAIELYKRINLRGKPEESIPLRVAVLAAVLISAWAVIAQRLFSPLTDFGVIAGILVGYVVSYLRRDKLNFVLQTLLSLGLLAFTALFLYEVSAMPYDTRIPLAKLFLWVQVLHSFDLPRRRDLQFSLVSSLILISVAGIMAFDMFFLVYLGIYAILALVCLFLFHIREYDMKVRELKIPVLSAGKIILGLLLSLSVLSGFLFAAIPRFSGMRVQALPFSLTRALAGTFGGAVENPVYPSIAGRLPYSPLKYSKDAYPGFASALDLRTRGRLSDKVMMRVKVTQPVYHRALVFDTYTGKGWERSSRKTQTASAKGRPPITLPIKDVENSIGAREVISSYYIEVKHPNIIFAPYQPALLYFPANVVWIDGNSALTSAFALDSDVVYSVVSRVDTPRPPSLRLARSETPASVLKQNTRLPDIPDRVRKLSLEVTKGQDNNYDKAIAIMKYLEDDYRYDVDLPPQAKSDDAVDFFLFKAKKGACDQFSSAFTVIARANGIPARLVSGYTTGIYNPFTGYYEVRAQDAHSWAEVYFPNNGWVAFDPTPGTEFPSTRPAGGTFMLVSLGDYLKERLGGRFDLIKASLDSADRILVSMLRSMTNALIIYGYAIIAVPIVCLLFLVIYIWSFTRSKKVAEQHALEPAGKGPRSLMITYFQKMIEAFSEMGVKRRTSQTPSEYLAVLLKRFDLPEIGVIGTGFEEAFYSDHPVGESTVKEARVALDRILKSIENMK